MDHATRRRSFETGFQVGLLSCFGNFKNCLATSLFFPCIWGRIAQKVSFMKLKGVIWAVILLALIAGMITCSLFYQLEADPNYNGKNDTLFYIAGGIFLLVGLITGLLRTQVRKAKNLSGNFVVDCLVSTVCTTCATCQMSTETEIADDACAILSCPDPDIV